MRLSKITKVIVAFLSFFLIILCLSLFFKPFSGCELPIVYSGKDAAVQIIKRFPELDTASQGQKLMFNNSLEHMLITDTAGCYFSGSGFIDYRIFIGFNIIKKNAFSFLNKIFTDSTITFPKQRPPLIETEPRHFGKKYPTDLWDPGKMILPIVYHCEYLSDGNSVKMVILYDTLSERLLMSLCSR